MRKILFLIVLLLCINIALAAVNTQYFGKAPKILINLIKQEPDPVEPGDEVEVSFQLENNGTQADNVVFEIIPAYPFSLIEGESASKQIGSLVVSQEGKRAVIAKYRLKISPEADNANYPLKVKYKTGSDDVWTTLENFKIKVQTHEAILAIDKFFTTPEVVAPGDKVKLRVELKNYATSILKDIRMVLDLGNAKTGDETPFSPLVSTNEKVISYIEPGAKYQIEYNLMVDADAVSKVYKIPLSVRYSDTTNRNYSRINVVSFVVGASPDLGIALERTTIIAPESTGSFVVRLVNKGTVDIKFLNVRILPNEDIKVIGADEAYIGKLDSDDFSTAEFKLAVKGNKNGGIIKVPVEAVYKDSNNNNYNVKKEVELNLYSGNEAVKLGLKKNGGFNLVVAIVVIGILGYFYIKKRRKRQK